jgi:hypothetical protein
MNTKPTRTARPARLIPAVQIGRTTFTVRITQTPPPFEGIKALLCSLTAPDALEFTLPKGARRTAVAPLIRSLRTTRRPFSYTWTSPSTLLITPTP